MLTKLTDTQGTVEEEKALDAICGYVRSIKKCPVDAQELEVSGTAGR